jgi:clan AA aspartic protease
MITGTVSNHRAYVNLIVRGANGQSEVEFVLDSGFTGALTLPPADCIALGLRPDRIQPSFLADRTRILLEVFAATLMWDGVERQVEVLAMEGAPLLGMTVLSGNNIRIQAMEGGLVAVEPL